ncbi:hypothetical protein Pint_13868 [Pistacia integerrima]|uniref:Uncharacterized protein n=1 Tax=Pistacia integerrima TaxID=434235 RepID=A0ACC0Y8V2_9ROSI|nr:hypothetical protein Pint_13868 [Pistacia integerrima]
MDDERLVYTLDKAFTYVGFGKFQVVVLLYAGLGLFAEAMEVMILSFIGPAIKSEWRISPAQESLLTTVVFAGLLLVDLFICPSRKGFLGGALVASVIGLMSAFSPNYITLVTLRGLNFSGHVGTIFEASLGWIVMPRLNWRWLLALSCVPTFAVLLLQGLAPESLRYLCMGGQTADAHHILEKIALKNGNNLPSGRLLPDNIARLDDEFVVLALFICKQNHRSEIWILSNF